MQVEPIERIQPSKLAKSCEQRRQKNRQMFDTFELLTGLIGVESTKTLVTLPLGHMQHLHAFALGGSLVQSKW